MNRKVDVVIQPHYDDGVDVPDARYGFVNCNRCLVELQRGFTETGEPLAPISPEEYARQQAGATEDGWQIWCIRHNCNIVRISITIKQERES